MNANESGKKNRSDPDTFLQNLESLIESGRAIRCDLPGGGRLHVDRSLPFLCVYRIPSRRADPGTEQLVLGEASYLIASGKGLYKPLVTKIVKAIAEKRTKQFGAFLLIEIFSSVPRKNGEKYRTSLPAPGFRIISSPVKSSRRAVEALEDELSTIKILKKKAAVELDYRTRISPGGMSGLISHQETLKKNWLIIGLEVDSIYRDPETGHLFPIALRTLQRGVSKGLKKAFFEFSQYWTNHETTTYLELGRKACVRAVWDVDRQLAEINNTFDFLLLSTPINAESAFNSFRSRRFEKTPEFHYRPRPLDPVEFKSRLFRIPIQKIEDPTLTALFREKQIELDRQLTMLNDRGTRNFLYGSLQLFGGVSRDLEKSALEILETLPPKSRESSRDKKLTANEFAQLARQEIASYQRIEPDFKASVRIRDDVIGLLVSQGNLLIGRNVQIPKSRSDALIQHEVGTHIVTYYNGRSQPFQQLYCGLPGYDEMQEGLAVLGEHLSSGLSRPRLRLLAGRVVAVKCLVDGASFVETFRILNKDFGFEKKVAFTIVTRVFRSGGLTKDAVYLRGLKRVVEYIGKGGDLEVLFMGKIAVKHIPVIQELLFRKVLKPVPILPAFIKNQQKLEKLKSINSIVELASRRRK